MDNYIKYLTDYITKVESKINTAIDKPIVSRVGFGLVLIASFVLMYVLNVLHPLFGDDWNYGMMPETHQRISSFREIMQFEYNHYFEWGGRIVVHIIAQTLLLLGESTGDLLNSLAYVALTLTIYSICNHGNKLRPSLLLAINLLVWFLHPAFASTMLWLTGSANYLWGTLIVVGFLLPYTRELLSPEKSNNTLRAIAFFFGGIIAGWTNENVSVAMICMLAFFLYTYKAYNNFIPRWAVAGLIGAVIGCVMMIVAPGNYLRMNVILAESSVQVPAWKIFIARFIGALTGYYFYVLLPSFIFFVALWLNLNFGRNKQKPIVLLAWIFFFGAILATLAMSASPIFPGRATYGIITFVIIGICLLVANLDFSELLIRRLLYTSLVFAMLFFVADYYRGYKELKGARTHLDQRMEKIEQAKNAGVVDLVLDDRIYPEGRFFHYYELTPNVDDWHNQMFSGYYGINSIVIK